MPRRGAPPPPQTRKKQLYDVLGVLTTVMLTNYGTLPFMLLTVDDSFVAWNSVVWYGHFLIGGALLFFYLGGSVVLHQVQAVRIKQAAYQRERDDINRKVRTHSISSTPSSPSSPRNLSYPSTPMRAPTLPPLDEVAQEVEKELRKEKKKAAKDE